MPVAVDAMGGDRGSGIIVEGAIAAARERGVESILVGKEEQLQADLKRLGGEGLPLSIYPASQVVEMGESPAEAMRRKKDSSIQVAFNLVKEGKAHSVVSAGNSGATLATAMFTLGRIKGVRPAICTLMPTLKEPLVLIDVGANVDCKPLHLLQFGIMASVYYRECLKTPNPRVGLMSIGEEDSKGNQQVKKAYDLLSASDLNFVGNVEGRDLFRGDVEVIVCDGFVGNICLKLSEGLGEAVLSMLRTEIRGSLLATLGYTLARTAFKRFQKRVDYAEYGGAPLLGINGVALICHGMSPAKALKNAIISAQDLVDIRLAQKLADSLSKRQDLLRLV